MITLLSSILLAFILFFKKQINIKKKLLLISILLLPLTNLLTGISVSISNLIKGEIVLSIIDDTFISSEYIVVRSKNESLIAEYEFSVSGFSNIERGKFIFLSDSIITYKLISREHCDTLLYDEKNKIFISLNTNKNYRILVNKLLK